MLCYLWPSRSRSGLPGHDIVSGRLSRALRPGDVVVKVGAALVVGQRFAAVVDAIRAMCLKFPQKHRLPSYTQRLTCSLPYVWANMPHMQALSL